MQVEHELQDRAPNNALELTGLSRAEFGVGFAVVVVFEAGLVCKAARQLSFSVGQRDAVPRRQT
jgi:ribosomal protein L13E